MKLIRLAAGVLNQTPLDWDGNQDRIVQAIGAAREAGSPITVFAGVVHHRLRLRRRLLFLIGRRHIAGDTAGPAARNRRG